MGIHASLNHTIRHGRGEYCKGCRCDTCVEANREYQKLYSRAIQERESGHAWEKDSPNDPMMPLYILTCEARQESLRATLRSLAATDWTSVFVVVSDEEAIEDIGIKIKNPRDRGTAAYAHILRLFLNSSAEHVLICEDDVEFNVHLAHNIAKWSVMKRPDFALGNLYNQGHEVSGEDLKDAFEPRCSACYGSQGLIVTRRLAAQVLKAWDSYAATGQDIIIFTECPKVGKQFVHRPSLVQHVATSSLLKNTPHKACDFNLHWKAP